MVVGCAWQGACIGGKMAIAAGGTHPTGMYSCVQLFFSIFVAANIISNSKRRTCRIIQIKLNIVSP